MSQELFKLSTSFNCVPQGDERIALRLYYKHAATLLQHFEEWKDIDRFYFIPLRLNMAYFCAGGGTAVAFPPYYVGTILRNSLEHPDLFCAECTCGHRAYAYAYNGSPLSGRFDLSCACPECGTGISSIESGWRVRSNALRATQEEDLKRGRRMALLHPRSHPATIQELLRFCGVSDEEMVLPPEEHKITKHILGNGRVLVSDSAGGCGIIEEYYSEWGGCLFLPLASLQVVFSNYSADVCASLCNFNTSNSIKNCIFVFVILTGNILHIGKRLALFLTDESGQFVVTGIMFNRLCLAISGFAHAIAKREQLNLIRHARPSRADQ